jgi:hypothetical protein
VIVQILFLEVCEFSLLAAVYDLTISLVLRRQDLAATVTTGTGRRRWGGRRGG